MQQGGARDPKRGETSAVEAVVQAQVDAYNRRDIDAFMRTYAPDVKIYDFPNTLRSSGSPQMRERYATLFRRFPDLTATITNRMVQGRYVIDHEEVTGLSEDDCGPAVAVYEVRGAEIINVWFLE
jgi:hypothetical protein